MDDAAVIPDPPASAAPAETEPPAAAAAKTESARKHPYPSPASTPTQAGPHGIKFDFNQGARLVLPNRTEGKWRVRLRDLDTGNILFQTENQGAFVSSSKRFYVRIGIEVWELDAAGAATRVLAHEYDARGREVLIQFPVGTLGDILAWFSYAARFGEVHGCKLTCAMSNAIIPLLRDAYPAIRFVTHEERPIASGCFSTTRISSINRPISAMSGCTAPPATSSASIRRRRRRAWCCRTKPARSSSGTSASRCRVRPRPKTGPTRTAGTR
jgi:hypothetical protein